MSAPQLRQQHPGLLATALEIPCADPGFTAALTHWSTVIATRITGSGQVSGTAVANAAIAVAWAAAAGVSVVAATPGPEHGERTVVAGLMVPNVSNRMLDRAKAGLVRAVIDAKLPASVAASVLDQTAVAAGLRMVRAVDAPDRQSRRQLQGRGRRGTGTGGAR